MKHLGQFSAAQEVFPRELAEHMMYSFLILNEYAEMLYEQGHYRLLFDLILEYHKHPFKLETRTIDRRLDRLYLVSSEMFVYEKPNSIRIDSVRGIRTMLGRARGATASGSRTNIDIDCIKVFAKAQGDPK